jgi:hypothetical protein
MKRCRIGMLAFIRDSEFPQNIGLVVRVVDTSSVPDNDWAIASDSAIIIAAVAKGKRPVEVPPGGLVSAADSDLVPILPPNGEMDVLEYAATSRVRRLEHHFRNREKA